MREQKDKGDGQGRTDQKVNGNRHRNPKGNITIKKRRGGEQRNKRKDRAGKGKGTGLERNNQHTPLGAPLDADILPMASSNMPRTKSSMAVPAGH